MSIVSYVRGLLEVYRHPIPSREQNQTEFIDLFFEILTKSLTYPKTNKSFLFIFCLETTQQQNTATHPPSNFLSSRGRIVLCCSLDMY